MTYVLMALGTALLLAYVLYPLSQMGRRSEGNGTDRHPAKLRELMEARSEVLSALKDLEFEYHTGKISAEDYAELKKEYEVKAYSIFQQLDQLEGNNGTSIEERIREAKNRLLQRGSARPDRN
jgi:hypothetical protein